ncbi:MAG: peptidyl-prolyl cis-trans isomerase, partial [Candidatus Latescibacterota bacterium]
MKVLAQILFILLSGLLVLGGCGKGDGGGDAADTDISRLAAEVNDWTMTKDEIEAVIAKLSDSQKKRYDNDEGRADLTDRFLEEELFFQEGMKSDLENDESVQEKLKQAKRRIIIGEYYRKYIEEIAQPTEEEARQHYQENQDTYITPEIVRARHLFSKREEKIREMKQRINNGEKMTKLITEHSEDTLTKQDEGDLGYFNPGGYIRFVGYSQDFSDAVFALELGEVSEPIKWEKGWSIVYIEEKRPEKLKDFEEVKDEISQRVGRIRIEEVRRNVVA